MVSDLHPRQRESQYDFIVVGSGAGGAPLACHLARNGFRVLVLEAGGWDEPEVSQTPAFHPHATEHPDLSWEFFVKHYDHPPELDSKPCGRNGGIYYPRTATVGGCTMHNAMITICGPTGDWDEIAAITNDDSWSGARMRRYFQRVEHNDYVKPPSRENKSLVERIRKAVNSILGRPYDDNPGRYGFDGWLHTSRANPLTVVEDKQLLLAVLAALHEASSRDLDTPDSLVGDVLKGVIWERFDPNHWGTLQREPEGLVLIPIAVNHGVRSGPREWLRQTMKEHPNLLVVQCETLAAEVLFDERLEPGAAPKAIGVRVRRGKCLYRAHPQPCGQEGKVEEVFCRREVILCGGAYNTPQLLKLSGIGPAQELSRWQLPVRVPLAGVGTNLQDRYEVGIIAQMCKDFSLLKGLALGPPQPGRPADPALEQWQTQRTGLYSTNAAILGIFKKSSAELPAPDLFIFALPGCFRGYYKGYSRDIATKHDLLTWAILKAHTNNRAGTVNLKSVNPLDMPDINFHYFNEGSDAEGADLAALIAGVKFVREMNQIAVRKGAVQQEVWPGAAVAQDDEAVARFIAREAWGHHASCSCPIGADGDPMAVLDSRFRVRGTRNLRVVDASVFPRIPGVFIVTNIYMTSAKAGDVIAEDNR